MVLPVTRPGSGRTHGEGGEMKRKLGLMLALVLAASGIALAAGPSYLASNQAKGFDPSKLTEEQDRILSGFGAYELAAAGSQGSETDSGPPSTYNPRGSDACPNNISSNIKVN